MIGIFQGSEYARDTQSSKYASMLLNNGQVYLNMLETEPKITLQAKQHLYIHIHRCI